MLKKINRLSKRGDIQAVFTRGRIFFNPYFNVKSLASKSGKRFAIVISTKVYKKAVLRNRLRRVLRECLKNNLLNIKSGDYVIIAKPKVSSITETEALKNFSLVFSKVINDRRY